MNAQAFDPETLMDAAKVFADVDKCHDYMVSMRWPDGVKCIYCESDKIGFVKSRRVFQCKACRKQFTVKVGTIFEESPIALEKWLFATWMISNCKNGVSSCEIAREIGVTQKTAWFMLQRIRLAMQDEGAGKLSGLVEVDETFIGARARNMHESKKARLLKNRAGFVGKTIVLGALDRHDDQVRTRVVKSTKRKVLDPNVREMVEAGSEIHTDAAAAYERLEDEYEHHVVDHMIAYVNGNVHTNGLENYWSLLKRMLRGTYVSVEPFHLFRYLDELAHRYNRRKMTNRERFECVLRHVAGKRLTYAKLTSETQQTVQ